MRIYRGLRWCATSERPRLPNASHQSRHAIAPRGRKQHCWKPRTQSEKCSQRSGEDGSTAKKLILALDNARKIDKIITNGCRFGKKIT